MRQHKPAAATSSVEDLLISLPFEGRLGASIGEVAACLGVQRDTVYRMVLDGRLIASKVGRRTIVHTVSVHQYLAVSKIALRPRVRRDRTATPKPIAPKPPRRGKSDLRLLETATTLKETAALASGECLDDDERTRSTRVVSRHRRRDPQALAGTRHRS
jgi:excisionase family DNA binding protein